MLLEISKDEFAEASRLLRLTNATPDTKECAVLLSWSVVLGNAMEADVEVCNGDAGPWAQIVWYDHGWEVGCSEVLHELEGRHVFEDYSIEICVKEH